MGPNSWTNPIRFTSILFWGYVILEGRESCLSPPKCYIMNIKYHISDIMRLLVFFFCVNPTGFFLGNRRESSETCPVFSWSTPPFLLLYGAVCSKISCFLINSPFYYSWPRNSKAFCEKNISNWRVRNKWLRLNNALFWRLLSPKKNLRFPGMETQIQRELWKRDGEILEEVAGGSEAWDPCTSARG